MIAESCFISTNTVNSHIRKIYDKLHVNSSHEAVSKALRQKLIWAHNAIQINILLFIYNPKNHQFMLFTDNSNMTNFDSRIRYNTKTI